MDIKKGSVVKATAGRDKGRLFFVVYMCQNFINLVDGKIRKLEKPKKKKLKHIELVGNFDIPVAQKIQAGDKVLNSEIRKALSEVHLPND